MKKILIIVPTLKIGGGAQKIAYKLATGLMENKDFSVTLATFYRTSPEYDFEGHRLSFDEKKIGVAQLVKLFSRSLKIYRLCREHDIDIVISFMEEANFCSILSKFWGNKAKIFVSIRSNPGKYGFLYMLLIKTLYPRADRVITNTQKMKEIIKDIADITNSQTIYNFIEQDECHRLSLASIPGEHEKLFQDKFNFVTIGRLCEVKGQRYLLQAFHSVIKKYPTANLWILGEGELFDTLGQLINDLGLKKNVFLLGRQANVYSYLKRSDCFVLSSLWEGFPNAILEALSLNLPVISTDCLTGPREIIAPELSNHDKIIYPYRGQYGILVKPFLDGNKINISLPLNSKTEEINLLAKAMIGMIEQQETWDNQPTISKFEKSAVLKQWITLIQSS